MGEGWGKGAFVCLGGGDQLKFLDQESLPGWNADFDQARLAVTCCNRKFMCLALTSEVHSAIGQQLSEISEEQVTNSGNLSIRIFM